MDELRKSAIEKLLRRKAKLQEAYDQLILEPASYGITGSVSATNRSLTDIRTELVAIDKKISALITNNSVAGMSISYPDYRHSPFGGLQ